MLVQLLVAREVWARIRPRHLQGSRCLDGVPFLLGNNGEQILDPDHLRAGDIFDRCFVDLDRHRARNPWPDHAGMQHAWQPHVVYHFKRAEDLARQIAARE